ncbi:hypothetical protein Emag_000002 [Eimeria magna]
MQTVRAEDQGWYVTSCAIVRTWNGAPVAARNSTASSNGAVFNPASTVTLVPRQEPRSRPVPSYVTLLDSEDQVLRRFPRRRPGGDRFRPEYCPAYVLYSRVAFRRLGPQDLNRTFASPTLGEVPNFADYRGFSRESVFAVLMGPGWVMRSGEPCWLVVCSLRDVFREVVYDRAMREIFPSHSLRRYVEIPPHLCPPREEARAQGSPDNDAASPSTPTTSVGGSPAGDSSPVDAPEALEPLERPRRRRRIGPPSLPSPTPPDSPDEAQSPSATADNDSAGGVADSSEGAVPSSSH